MKKTLLSLLLILSLVFLGACGKNDTQVEEVDIGNFHTELQDKYLSGDYTKATIYAKGSMELSRPLPITLTWDNSASIYTVLVKKKGESSGLELTTDEAKVEIYNLLSGTTYEWYVNDERKGEFTTASSPRNLYIDGLTNVRDIGGYNTTDGKVKQGLMIRSSKLTDDNTGQVLITISGIEELIRLGIKTELDLREVEPDSDGSIEQGLITESALPGVKYISFPMKSGGNYLQLNKDILPELFEILADKDNYPILFHCSIGTDRTGVVAFLVNALLGVSKEDLYRDYLFSNFGLINVIRLPKVLDDYIDKVTSNKDLTLQENVRIYLLNQGVKEENINKVIEIMSEK